MPNISVQTINDKNQWNSFLLKQNPNTFLQSWQWGQVQASHNSQPHYLGIFDKAEQIGACLALTVSAKRGRFLLIPHGPILPPAHYQNLVNYLKDIAKQESAIAIRIAPLTEDNPSSRQLFKHLGFRSSPIHMHAELTWVLDINHSKPDLLNTMRKTTRHAINKALKNTDLKTEIITTPDQAINRFWHLYVQTGQRHDFVPYSKETILTQLKLMPSFTIIASHKNHDIAGAIIFLFGQTAFYYHGASQKLPSNIPASHLVQWQAILEAKRRSCTHYNFWGIAQDGQTNHPFAGITIFKKGFGGEAKNYLHAQDLPLSLKYWRLWLVDTFRKLKRGF